MPQPPNLTHATLEEIWWDKKGQVQPNAPTGQTPKVFPVQFNPQSLKLNYSNQKSGGDQPKGSSTQFVGRGVTKMTLELWFDLPLAIAQGRQDAQKLKDVRELTSQVAYFMIPQKVPGSGKNSTVPPPGVRFRWGTFTFEGTMDGMDETLDLFSSDGSALRSSVSISLSKQEIQYNATNASSQQNPQTAGTQPQTPAKSGDTVQQLAAKAGASDWKSLALANGIENPRILAPGALVNLSTSVSASARLTGGGTVVSGGAQIGVSLRVQGGATIGGASQLGFAAGASMSANGSLGFEGSTGASVGGGASIGAGPGSIAGAGIGASAGVGVGGQAELF
jgi:hypothetical protein